MLLNLQLLLEILIIKTVAIIQQMERIQDYENHQIKSRFYYLIIYFIQFFIKSIFIDI